VEYFVIFLVIVMETFLVWRLLDMAA